MAITTDWIQTKLRAKEEIIFTTRSHFFMLFVPALIISLGYFWWFYYIIGVPFLLWNFYKFLSLQYLVTNQRVLYKKGLFYIRLKEFELENITDIVCSKTYSDRIIGSGTILLVGANFTTEKTGGIAQPEVFRDAVRSQL